MVVRVVRTDVGHRGGGHHAGGIQRIGDLLPTGLERPDPQEFLVYKVPAATIGGKSGWVYKGVVSIPNPSFFHQFQCFSFATQTNADFRDVVYLLGFRQDEELYVYSIDLADNQNYGKLQHRPHIHGFERLAVALWRRSSRSSTRSRSASSAAARIRPVPPPSTPSRSTTGGISYPVRSMARRTASLTGGARRSAGNRVWLSRFGIT